MGFLITVIQRAIGNLIIPAAFFIAVSVYALNQDLLPAMPATVWLIGPSVALAIAGTLALSYNRSRVFLTSCLLAACLWLAGQQLQLELLELIVIGIVPMNIGLVCFYKERGAFTAYGLVRLFLIAAQIALAVILIDLGEKVPEILFNPFTDPMASLLVYLPYNQMASLMLVITTLVCLVLLGLDDMPITQGIVAAFVGLCLAHSLAVPNGWEIYLIASSIYLGASIIRDSYNMAYRDELTGLPQRRALNEQFLSLGSKYSVAMADVDHFKKFNDTYGHDIGDQVLQLVATKIGQVGGGGRAFRYGGEEFSIVFPRMSKSDAFYHLDEVRKAIENYEMVVREDSREEDEPKESKKQRTKGSFRTATTKVSVTISIGVAEREGAIDTPEEVLKAADKALYVAKRGGRNKVSIAD
jgi:diguanylate cyclase (GGDEF)-like protein